MGVWTMAGWRAAAAVGVICVASMCGVAGADEQLDKANALYSTISKEKRSDLVILPALSAMDPAPKEPGDYLAAFLMTPQSSGWEAAAAWAKAPKQQAALDALNTVTKFDDKVREAGWAFGQPYGAAVVDPKFVDMKLYTELGEDNTLAAAQFLYLPAIRKLEILCHVEATRLLADGKGNDALELMRRWAIFSYQIADRKMLKEKLAGMDMLSLAFQRMRDLAYTDMIAEKRSMTPEGVGAVINKIGGRSPIDIERLHLPEAEKLAAEQLVSRTFTANGGPNPASFARVYAQVASGDRALRRFSESAKWDTILKLHGNYAETMKRIGEVYGDWDKRWDISQWDAIQELPTDYSRLDKVQFAALDLVMGDVGQVFPKRRELRAEWIGTRASLAVYAYRLKLDVLPIQLESVVPQYVPINKLMTDPFDKDAKQEKGKRVVYVRAGVDNMPVGAESKPVAIRVFPKVAGVEFPNFEAKVMTGQFVIYSAGPDGNQNGVARATQMVRDDHGDYLIWPPALSLVRQWRIDNPSENK
jgi:hypothetical protein